MALVCAVLSLGRLDWWFEAPWLGWSLAGAVVLIVSAIAFEHNRTNPLLNTKWLSSGSILRLGLIMLLIRIVLAEQNTGVIGWLQYVGLQNEQMTNLAWSIFAGIVCGIVASCLTLNPQRLYWPTATALALIMIASLLDSQSTALTRPEQLMFSQFLLGFGSAFFLAPAMLAGIGGDCRPAESGQLLGSVWHEPKYRRPARLSYPRYFSDLARKISFQPVGRSDNHAEPVDRRATAAVQPDVSKPDWRQHAIERAGYHAAAKRLDATGQYSRLQ